MYLTGTPSRAAIAAAMSADTPEGSPDGVLPVTRRKFPMLIAARSTPVGASSAIICGVGVAGMAGIRLADEDVGDLNSGGNVGKRMEFAAAPGADLRQAAAAMNQARKPVLRRLGITFAGRARWLYRARFRARS